MDYEKIKTTYNNEEVTMKNLYDLLLEVVKKNNVLEKKLDNITNILSNGCSDTDMLEILNSNNKNKIGLDDLLQGYDYDLINSLLKKSFIEMIVGIFKIVAPCRNRDNPIKCFETYPNKIYIFNNNNWQLDESYLKKSIDIIEKKLISSIGDKMRNQSNIDLYLKCIQKITNSSQENNRKICTRLYKYYKK